MKDDGVFQRPGQRGAGSKESGDWCRRFIVGFVFDLFFFFLHTIQLWIRITMEAAHQCKSN